MATSDEDAVCDARSLLLATREDGVHAVLNAVPVVPGRGVLAMRAAILADTYWLKGPICYRLRSADATS